MSYRFAAALLAFFLFFGQAFFVSAENPSVSSDENPFAAQDQARRDFQEVMMSDARDGGLTAAEASDFALPEAPGTAFIVKFSDSCSMATMASLLNSENYTLLGYSEMRMVRLLTQDLSAFLSKAGDNIEYSEEDAVITDEALPVHPNDPYYSEQYMHSLMNVESAWGITTGSASTVVAVIDSGVDRTHEDFVGVNILNGTDFVDGGTVLSDPRGHGTMVTGVIAAKVNNSIGIAGICPSVSILPLRVTTPTGGITIARVVSALTAAADAGVRVVNLSMGGDAAQSERDAVAYAVQKGCIIICSAGNSPQNIYNYPASYDSVISVGSVDSDGLWSTFSTFNDRVDIAAPGENVLTTVVGSKYAYVDGTSFSSPAVAALAALAVSIDPDITAAQFTTALTSTATDTGAYGYDTKTGSGIADAHALLAYISGNPLQTYTVTFEANGGSPSGTVIAKAGHYMTPPVEPTKDGLMFGGWYEDSNFTNPFNFETEKPTKSMTLYARWTLSPIGDFVSRLYTLCLGRTADSTGLSYWSSQLSTWQMTGSDVAYGFVFSPEFQSAHTSDEVYVNILYKAFFNRDPDPTGKQEWLSALSSGLSRYYVLHGFTNSTEFQNLTLSYGIDGGALVLSEPEDCYPGTAQFVTRMYKECLGRTPDVGGLRDWILRLQSWSATGSDVADGFVFSDEFTQRNLTDKEYVERLYHALFDRPADTTGLSNWLSKLSGGSTRHEVLAGFTNSQEFAQLCGRYGIIQGTL